MDTFEDTDNRVYITKSQCRRLSMLIHNRLPHFILVVNQHSHRVGFPSGAICIMEMSGTYVYIYNCFFILGTKKLEIMIPTLCTAKQIYIYICVDTNI